MKKPLKYRNEKVEVDGLKFDSRGEARRYAELQLLERAGEIRNLERQVPFRMVVGGKLICTLKVDFAYFEGDRRVAEDFKNPVTAKEKYFRLKAKLMQALYPGVELRLVT